MKLIFSLIKILVTALLLLLAVVVGLTFVPSNVPPASEAGSVLPALPAASENVSIHFLESARAESPEAFAIAQGSLLTNTVITHGAILVSHSDQSFLYDTGLGRNVDQQFKAMPSWIRPLMAYEKGVAVADQIAASDALPMPDRIFLSHAHWDHGSGVEDFPGVPLWVTSVEKDYLENAQPPAVISSQFDSPEINWQQFELHNTPYAGFEKSFDIYGDGTAVLVSLSGHTPGSLGLFVNANDGVRRLFVGDAVWKLASVVKLRRKFVLSSLLVDHDSDNTDAIIAKLHALLVANPELKIIPAHDAATWK